MMMMNSTTVQRLWNKKDKQGTGSLHVKGKSLSASTAVQESPSLAFYGLFSTTKKPANASDEQKVKTLRNRIGEAKSIILPDSQLIYALHSLYASGDGEKAFDLTLAVLNSWQGSLIAYKPTVKLLGAENRSAVTCYLDSVLFAMFARLDSFEAMLHKTFKDDARNRLCFMLRLWVNLFRSGSLVTTDITQLLQESLAGCGWKAAGELHQQDASEAFAFLTETLELPLLTLKMDIYHIGREDATDDHKFINERLLEVAIPPSPPDSDRPVPLEDCLEAYFNNRIEVKRYLGLRSALCSTRPGDLPDSISEKGAAVHVESVKTATDAPAEPTISSALPDVDPDFRARSPSIIQQRFIPDGSSPGDPPAYEAEVEFSTGRLRSGSIRKEVMMPAWQFFSLIPWYTDNTPKNDAQVAAHFSSKRPILGMCLKRYSFTEDGIATRLDTQIDIPTEIGLPHFISDDKRQEDGSIYGNFKLLLQSVVCHRGNSVDSGHYISLFRGFDAPTPTENDLATNGSSEPEQWMRFDDLAAERVTPVDINQSLKNETPYLLFYQIVPIDHDMGEPPDGETLPIYAPSDVQGSGASGMSLPARASIGELAPKPKLSLEVPVGHDSLRDGSPTRAQNRNSSVLNESSSPDEPVASDLQSTLSPSRRGSASDKKDLQSRSQSQTSEMFSKSFSRLRNRKSKESTPTLGIAAETNHPVPDGREAPTGAEDKGKGFFRKDKKQEKSKARLGKVSGISAKCSEEKPDRECCVM